MNIFEEIAQGYTYNGVVSLKALDDDIVALENQIESYNATLNELWLRGKKPASLIEKIRDAKVKLSLLKAVYRKESDKATPDDVILSILGISATNAKETESPETAVAGREPKPQNFIKVEAEPSCNEEVKNDPHCINKETEVPPEEIIVENISDATNDSVTEVKEEENTENQSISVEKTPEPNECLAAESESDSGTDNNIIDNGNDILDKDVNFMTPQYPNTPQEIKEYNTLTNEDSFKDENEHGLTPNEEINPEDNCVYRCTQETPKDEKTVVSETENKEEEAQVTGLLASLEPEKETSIPKNIIINEEDNTYVIPAEEEKEETKKEAPSSEDMAQSNTDITTGTQYETIDEENDISSDIQLDPDYEKFRSEVKPITIEDLSEPCANNPVVDDPIDDKVQEYEAYETFEEEKINIYSSVDLSEVTNMINTDSAKCSFNDMLKTLAITLSDIRDYPIFVELLKQKNEKKCFISRLFRKPKNIFMSIYEKIDDKKVEYHYKFIDCVVKEVYDSEYTSERDILCDQTTTHECYVIFKYKKLKIE